ncbi:hypothetical protein, partial [Ensifer aridi]|uniref:hypothetical protein n=1 Tax=Ensifer aridi TaxID=1708715 RepID=UPI001AECDE4A
SLPPDVGENDFAGNEDVPIVEQNGPFPAAANHGADNITRQVTTALTMTRFAGSRAFFARSVWRLNVFASDDACRSAGSRLPQPLMLEAWELRLAIYPSPWVVLVSGCAAF